MLGLSGGLCAGFRQDQARTVCHLTLHGQTEDIDIVTRHKTTTDVGIKLSTRTDRENDEGLDAVATLLAPVPPTPPMETLGSQKKSHQDRTGV